MNDSLTNPKLLASVEAANQASETALHELEAAHSTMHQEYKRLGDRIRMLWTLPLPRPVLLALLLDAVDRQAQTFPASMRWEELFSGFRKPTGKRPPVPVGAAPSSNSWSRREGPLSLCDLKSISRYGSSGSLFDLERLLWIEEADPMGSMRQGPPIAAKVPASFVGAPSNQGGSVATHGDVGAMLCFFMGDAIKAKLTAWFDTKLPKEWPTRPDDISDADWCLTPDERMQAIAAADAKRSELLPEMRAIDQQILQLAPRHRLGELARVRITTPDTTY